MNTLYWTPFQQAIHLFTFSEPMLHSSRQHPNYLELEYRTHPLPQGATADLYLSFITSTATELTQANHTRT